MKPKSILATFLLFAGVFSFSMMGYLSGVRASRQKNAPPPVMGVQKQESPNVFTASNSTMPENIVKDFTRTSYVLRENEGRLALFIKYSNGDEQIHSDYDISVKLLPESDRKSLEKGIELDSLNDALQLVEDYVE